MANLGEFTGEDLGTITIVDPNGSTQVVHFYTCAHCSNSIIIEPTRARPRVKCTSCGGVICEKKQICRAGCTPLNELADDHFEASLKWQRYVNAVMHGANSVDEGVQQGLINPLLVSGVEA